MLKAAKWDASGNLVAVGVKTVLTGWRKCVSCGELRRTGERLWDFTPHERKPTLYCEGCLDCGENNHSPEVGDRIILPLGGDDRVFLVTPNGVRAGFPLTGVRCEDAPHCGCC